MKKIYTILVAVLITASVFAQTPEAMSYQAVIRNASNQLVTNQGIGMQISILQGSATGTAVYVETHNTTTNANGLVTVELGNGTVVSGDFATIDWSADTYFIKTETDPTTAGGTSYTITGTSQLLSVAYALQAKKVENVDYSQITNTPNLFDGDWSSLTGTTPNVSTFNNDAGYLTSYTETDLIFTAWDKSTGISITESQISDFGTYLTSETDPVYSANFDLTGTANGDLLKFDGTKFVKFTPNYLTSYTETDPTFTAWDKSTGISITESQISDFGTYLTSETDPVYSANFDLTGTANGDLLKFDGTKFVKFTPNYLTSYTETDPIFTAWDKDYADLTNKPANATTTTDGFMSSADKTKLDGLTNADGSETKVTAGTNVTVNGTGTSGDPYVVNATAGGGSTHYVGELYGGGIIYYIDQTGEHGLIASLDDLDGGSGVAWSNITDIEIGATAKDYYNGVGNTTAIIAQNGNTSNAAKLCAHYSNDGFTDWYLPSTLELREMDNSILIINNVLSNDANGTTNPIHPEYVSPTYGRYWSSTEYSNTAAWCYYFYYGYSTTISKSYTFRVRAVRAF